MEQSQIPRSIESEFCEATTQGFAPQGSATLGFAPQGTTDPAGIGTPTLIAKPSLGWGM